MLFYKKRSIRFNKRKKVDIIKLIQIHINYNPIIYFMQIVLVQTYKREISSFCKHE